MLRSWPYPLSGSPASILFFPGHSNTPRCSSLFISAGGWRSNRGGRYDTEAVLNCELVPEQMILTLLPAVENRAAEPSATKASMRVYSIKSCPCSPVQNCVQNVVIVVCPFDG